MTIWLLLPAAVLVAAILLGRVLPRRALQVAGAAAIAIGLASVALLEWRYTTANTIPVTMPVTLDHAGAFVTPRFAVAIPGPYEIWLEFDHGADADFDCLTGAQGMEAQCPRADPSLNVGWGVAEDNAQLARGATDWASWHARQARLDPAAAARERRKYLDWQKKNADPSNNWPLYYSLGRFTAREGRQYAVALDVHHPAGALAAFHPRLVVGLSSEATHGLGVSVMIFAFLWVTAGTVFFLFTVKRGGAAA